MFDFIADGIDSLMQSIGDYFLYNIIYKFFYILETGLCSILSWVESLYRVFTGMDEVIYNDSSTSLFNVFFQNRAVAGVFLGMASIGIIFAFVSAIASVIRKGFDSNDKVKMSMGQILGNLFKSILIIICLNLSITIVTAFLDALMTAVDYEFKNAYALGEGPSEHTFTDEEFAAMGRIFNTIGNYSLNPSYKNRYSINACYNEIRPDLKFLANQKVFTFYYETKDKDGNVIPTWQSVIANIANAADYNKEQPLDVYNEGIANALSDAMDIIKSNASLEALESYQRISYEADNDIGFDRIVFVSATMGMGRTAAAKNAEFNIKPAINDALREPYYRGAKDIYNLDQVNQDFDISIFKTNYLVAYAMAVLLTYNMVLIILTAIVRIFNMLFLYVIAPPLVGLMPFDDGAKFKQWLTAFIIQTFSIFALIISMRLYLIFVPIVLGPNLTLSQSISLDMFGKLLLLYGGMQAINKANGIFTGILADQAGMQSIYAGEMKQSLNSTLGGVGAALKLGGKGAYAGAKWMLSSDEKKGSVNGGSSGGSSGSSSAPSRPLPEKSAQDRGSDEGSKPSTSLPESQGGFSISGSGGSTAGENKSGGESGSTPMPSRVSLSGDGGGGETAEKPMPSRTSFAGETSGGDSGSTPTSARSSLADAPAATSETPGSTPAAKTPPPQRETPPGE